MSFIFFFRCAFKIVLFDYDDINYVTILPTGLTSNTWKYQGVTHKVTSIYLIF
ncbi:hypothetical protein Hanom_Chr15g01359521 [Helianthus anomalus]